MTPITCRISIFESRGNQAKYRLDQLNNEMVCGLHWGPAGEATYDRFFRTQGLYKGALVMKFMHDCAVV